MCMCACVFARPVTPVVSRASLDQDPAVSEQELEALRGVFALFDTDGTGEIDSKEFATILTKVGRDPSEGAAGFPDVAMHWFGLPRGGGAGCVLTLAAV